MELHYCSDASTVDLPFYLDRRSTYTLITFMKGDSFSFLEGFPQNAPCDVTKQQIFQ